MTWEDELRQKLVAQRGDRPVRELADETGVNANALYKILSGERGIGGEVLETLRLTCPEMVADVFLSADSTVVERLSPIVNEVPA